jgi:hypothetical protein
MKPSPLLGGRYLENQFKWNSYCAYLSSKTLCNIKFYVGRHCEEAIPYQTVAYPNI